MAARVQRSAPTYFTLKSSSRSSSTPSRASSRAMALPMPRLPPVTIARLPRSPRSIADLLPRDFERGLAQAVDGEAHAVARRRELRGDAAARHHDHVALERAPAAVEQIGQPRHRLERMTHRIARLALALGAVVDPAARHRRLQIEPAPVPGGAEHHATVPGVL